jgi:hypothetical protein
MSQVDTRIDDARIRGAEVLSALMAYRRVNDGMLAAAVGASRTKVQGYRNGSNQLTIQLMCDFAYALNVDPFVFLMSPDEAVAWAIEHRPNGQGYTIRNRCFAAAQVRLALA